MEMFIRALCLILLLMTISIAGQEVEENAEGVANLNNGKYEAAAESLERAVALKPDYAIAYYNLGPHVII